MRRGTLFAIVLCTFVLSSPLAMTGVAQPVAEPADVERDTGLAESITAGGDVIEDEQRLALAPEFPGEIQVRHAYDIPDQVTEFTVRIPDRVTVRELTGFEHEEGRTYRWDGAEPTPSIAYRAEVNRTIDPTGPIAGQGEHIFADAGDWALVQRPRPGYSWSWSGDTEVTIDRSGTTEGPGAVSEVVAFLGPHETHVHTAHGQEFVLIEPQAADLVEEPSAIFDALSHASDHLRVGSRDERVFMVVAPTADVSWALGGLQTGAADLWVRDVESLDHPQNVWVHEYVHTRQAYSPTAETRWFTEATATYYAALFTLDNGRISFDEFRAFLEQGAHSRYEEVRLTDPATWWDNAAYFLGALISGELDRRIRTNQDGEGSLADAFRRVNDHDGSLHHEDVLSILATVGGSEIEERGDTFLRTTEHPEMWQADDHETAFGTDPPRFSFEVTSLQVSGPYRDGALTADDRPVLVPEEELAATITVTNRGGVAGEYDVPIRVNGSETGRVTARLDPGEREEIQLTRRLTHVGLQQLSVGEATITVEVREPAAVRVERFSVEPPRVEPGEDVTVELVVGNDASYPARGTIELTTNDAVADTLTVHLDRAETRTITTTVAMPEVGEVRIGIRDSELPVRTVLVGSGEDPTQRSIGGGVVAGMIAITVVIVLIGLGRRRGG